MLSRYLSIFALTLLAACGAQEKPAADAPATPSAFAPPPFEIAAPAGAYTIDKAHATLVFRLTHLGIAHYTAQFSDFDATLQFDPDDVAAMGVDASINVRSLIIPQPPEGFRDTLLGPQWLMSQTHPAITFASTRITQTGPLTADIEGDVTLLGVTAPVTLHAEYVGGYPGFHPHDPQARIGFSAYGKLSRSAFGMDQFLNGAGNPPPLSDEIEFRVDAEFLGPPTPPEITKMHINSRG